LLFVDLLLLLIILIINFVRLGIFFAIKYIKLRLLIILIILIRFMNIINSLFLRNMILIKNVNI